MARSKEHRLRLLLGLTLLQHQILTSGPLPDTVDFLDDSLEVRCGIVRTSNEDIVGLAGRCGSVQRGNRDKPRLHGVSECKLCDFVLSILTCRRWGQGERDQEQFLVQGGRSRQWC